MTSVSLFIPCFVDQIRPEIAWSMVKILEKVGCDVHYNPQQTCCGQPAFNAGYFPEAKSVAKKFLNDFTSNYDYIVSPSASCVGMIRNSYYQLFEDNKEILEKCHTHQKKIYELTEFLVDVLRIDKIENAIFEKKVTYHDSCSGLRECGIYDAPRKLLKNVRGLELIELTENETCCGFGGTFSVKFESISTAMADQKITHATKTEADYITSTDYSCLMHLDAFLSKKESPIQTIHIAEILASGW